MQSGCQCHVRGPLIRHETSKRAEVSFAYWSEVTPVSHTALTCEVNPSEEGCHMTEKTTVVKEAGVWLLFFPSTLRWVWGRNVIYHWSVIKDNITIIIFSRCLLAFAVSMAIHQDIWMIIMTVLWWQKCNLTCYPWVHAIWYMKADAIWAGLRGGYRMCWCVLSWRGLWWEHIDVDWFSVAVGHLRLALLNFQMLLWTAAAM